MNVSVKGAAGYAENAEQLAQQYESISFEAVHRDVLHLFPAESVTILDIGAGSGRDAAALAQRGHTVVAVEPTAALREEGQRLHGSVPIEWVDDHLPALTAMRESRRQFDLVMLTAVWMHLDELERPIAMRVIADLLAEGGTLIMSLRHGPVPTGRRMFDVSAEETIALAAQFGLEPLHNSSRGDMLDRADVSWSFVALRRPA